MKYTLTRNGIRAHTMSRNAQVVIPDEVADDQEAYDGRTFPALALDGRRIRVRLMGAEYGLWTGGTGDPVVAVV